MSAPILYGVRVAVGTNNVLSVDTLFIVHRHANVLYFRDQTPWLLIFPSAEISDLFKGGIKNFPKLCQHDCLQ